MARKKNKAEDVDENVSKPTIRSIKDFDSEVLDVEGDYVLVDFYADWCEYCKKMATIFSKLSSDFQNIIFLKMNIDDNQEVAEEYCEEGIPNLVLFKDGDVQSGFVGYDKIKAVKAWLVEAIKG